jgi:molecular chaperone GrpE
MSDEARVASTDGVAFDSAADEPDAMDGDVIEGEVIEPSRLEPSALGLVLPDDPGVARDMLLTHLAQSQAEADEYLAIAQRVTADFDNYRRRIERDQAETVTRAAQRIVEALLPSIDAFEAALAYQPKTAGEQSIQEGLRRAVDQLMEALGREGLEPIPSVGEPFDPAVHEAVSAVDVSGGDGDLVVTADLRKGYTLRGRVIRPALVTVGHQD